MQLRGRGCLCIFDRPELRADPRIFVESLGEELVVEIRVVDMQFSRTDADNGAVLLVHVLDLPDVRSAFDPLIVEFVPRCHDCKSAAGVFGKRTKVEPVDGEEDEIQ